MELYSWWDIQTSKKSLRQVEDVFWIAKCEKETARMLPSGALIIQEQLRLWG